MFSRYFISPRKPAPLFLLLHTDFSGAFSWGIKEPHTRSPAGGPLALQVSLLGEDGPEHRAASCPRPLSGAAGEERQGQPRHPSAARKTPQSHSVRKPASLLFLLQILMMEISQVTFYTTLIHADDGPVPLGCVCREGLLLYLSRLCSEASRNRGAGPSRHMQARRSPSSVGHRRAGTARR